MSITINSNMSASYSALNMKRANNLLTKSLQRLSSGKRITSPADDAGGLAVGLKLQSSMRRAAASMMNTQNGLSFLQMQDGAMKVAGEIVDRMAELKAFFNDVSKNALDRETYNHEFHELQKELNALKAQKFNGVSLFAMTEPDNNPLKIITSDDGLGEKIELSRTGFFENLKSRYGADGILNSGSHGAYRQLVGEFTEDGGTLDADPGKTSRNYASGQVIYKQGVSDDDSGYFMAMTDVRAGTSIEDSGDANSLFIRIADKGGSGFAESFSNVGEYNQYNTQFNADGEPMAYLKGDIVKVPAHWGSPGSYLFLEAESDIPQGITLTEMYDNGWVGGSGSYFSEVGVDTNGTGKPTTEFIRANGNLAEPTTMASGVAVSLASVMTAAGASNNYTPGFVQDGSDIYAPTHDWGVKTWNSKTSLREGDLFFESGAADNEFVKIIGEKVKGTYRGATGSTGDYVLHQGQWYKAESLANSTDIPVNGADVSLFSNSAVTSNVLKAGDALHKVADVSNYNSYVANANMKGLLTSKSGASAELGDVFVSLNSSGATSYFQVSMFTSASKFSFDNSNSFKVSVGNYLLSGGVFYKAVDATNADTQISISSAVSLAAVLANGGTASKTLQAITLQDMAGNKTTNVTTNVQDEDDTDYWTKSAWKTVTNPNTDSGFATDLTSQLSNLSNSKYWSKTHYGSLDGSTVNSSYTRGDNIYYQGKHYVYTSHLDSNDPLYVDPTNDGYTEFERLLELNAIRELPMYVDTIGGGGGAGLPDGVYYRPNQNLNFVDRLPNTGKVRTNSIERRTDAPLPPGDKIYNSQDDQFYGGLNAGNDGIYGTMDDFYASTGYSDNAKAGGHIDADADNNKNLLDTTQGLENFSVADFVDYIQTIANFRAVNGGTMSRLNYATRILEENRINLEAATSRIMDADMAAESTKLAQQNVLIQAGAAMVTQANQQASLVLSLLQ